MRMVLKIALGIALGIAWGLGLMSPAPALAQGVYFSSEQVLKDFFASSEKVSYERVEGAEARAALGGKPPRSSYVVYVARSAGRVDGYAVIDEEKGQHLPITFATLVAVDGTVKRTEVMAYRESHGEQIRQERFRKQFVGKGAGDALKVDHDVSAISGATISSRSMAVAVKRAIALVNVVRGRHAPRAN